MRIRWRRRLLKKKRPSQQLLIVLIFLLWMSVSFLPLLSDEEDKRVAAEIAPKTRYIPLDQDNPAAHVNAYLDIVHADDEDDGTDEDVDGEVLQKLETTQQIIYPSISTLKICMC